MKQIKISELSGRALDWVVAKHEGQEIRWDADLEEFVFHDREEDGERTWAPSTNSGQGHPIIETHMISMMWRNKIDGGCWWATAHDEPEDEDAMGQFGPTQLVAGLRCYVMSFMPEDCETVEVPEELL